MEKPVDEPQPPQPTEKEVLLEEYNRLLLKENARLLVRLAVLESPRLWERLVDMDHLQQPLAKKLKEEEGGTANRSAALDLTLMYHDTSTKCGLTDLEPEHICLIIVQSLLYEKKDWSLEELMERIKKLKAICTYIEWSMETCLNELLISIDFKRIFCHELTKLFCEFLAFLPKLKKLKYVQLNCVSHEAKIVKVLQEKSIQIEGFEIFDNETMCSEENEQFELIFNHCYESDCHVMYLESLRIDNNCSEQFISDVLCQTGIIGFMLLNNANPETIKLVFGLLVEWSVTVENMRFRSIPADLPVDEMSRYFKDNAPNELNYRDLSVAVCHQLVSVLDGLKMEPLNKVWLPDINDHELSVGEKQQLRYILKTSLKIAKKVKCEFWVERFGDDDFYIAVFSVLEEQEVQGFIGKVQFCVVSEGNGGNVLWRDLKRHQAALGKIGKIDGMVLVSEEAVKMACLVEQSRHNSRKEEIVAWTCLVLQFGIKLNKVIETQSAPENV